MSNPAKNTSFKVRWKPLVMLAIIPIGCYLALNAVSGGTLAQVLAGIRPQSTFESLGGVALIASYFVSVIVSPILLLASLLLIGYNRLLARPFSRG